MKIAIVLSLLSIVAHAAQPAPQYRYRNQSIGGAGADETIRT